jgi:hypothetical protein
MEPLAQDATTIKRVIAHVKENGVLPKEYRRPEIEHLITMYYFDAITLPNKNWVYRKWYHFKELLTDTIYNIRDSSWWYNFVQAITFKNALMVVLILLLAGAVLVIRKLKKNHEEEWKTLAKTVNELNNFESRSNNLYDSLHKIDNRNTVTALYSPMIGIKCYLAIVRTDSVGFKNPQSITNKLYQAVRKVTGNALCSRINLVVLNRDVDTMFFTQDFYFKGNKLIRECSGYKPIECDLLEINYVTPIE